MRREQSIRTDRHRVSIIVTCYNLAAYIGEAIESVLAQDYGEPVEIIVVDDCSTDRSAQIVRGYEEVQPLRMERNSGVLLAMLAGIEAAQGDFLFFLDGDDVWMPGKLSAATRAFDADPVIGFVTHDLEFMAADGTPLARSSRSEQVMSDIPAAERGEAVRRAILEHEDYVWLGSAFAVRRSVARIPEFAEWARRLPDPRNTYQDWPLAYWFATLPEVRFGYVAEKLFRYRLHGLNYSGDAASADKALRNFTRALNTARAMRDIAAMRQLPDGFARILDRRAAFLGYLVDLYSGRRLSATAGLLRSLGYLARRGLLTKELARFAGIQLLGARSFAAIAGRRTVIRDLAVS